MYSRSGLSRFVGGAYATLLVDLKDTQLGIEPVEFLACRLRFYGLFFLYGDFDEICLTEW